MGVRTGWASAGRMPRGAVLLPEGAAGCERSASPRPRPAARWTKPPKLSRLSAQKLLKADPCDGGDATADLNSAGPEPDRGASSPSPPLRNNSAMARRRCSLLLRCPSRAPTGARRPQLVGDRWPGGSAISGGRPTACRRTASARTAERRDHRVAVAEAGPCSASAFGLLFLVAYGNRLGEVAAADGLG